MLYKKQLNKIGIRLFSSTQGFAVTRVCLAFPVNSSKSVVDAIKVKNIFESTKSFLISVEMTRNILCLLFSVKQLLQKIFFTHLFFY
jgi:hypothetical protein